MEIKDVGQRIARLRKEMGLSQMALAEKLNVSDKAVSKWENGGMPGIDLLPSMSKLFNVSIDYLLTGKEDNNSSESTSLTKNENECTGTIKSAETETDTILNEEHIDVPKYYICPKCKIVNYHPTDRCQYCYHEFDVFDMMHTAYAEEETEEYEELVIEYDKETNKPICPKCHRINPYIDTHCIYCYHDFTQTRSPKKAQHTTGFYGNSYINVHSHTSSQPEIVYHSAPSSQAGCLLYFIAYLLPLIGLILGVSRKDRSLTIFSIAFMVVNFISAILLFSLLGLS